MRKWLLTAWCMLPVGATAFHFGPGQDHASLDQVAALMAEGQAFAREGRALIEKDEELAAAGLFTKADNAFSEALAMLPSERTTESQALRVELPAPPLLPGLPEGPVYRSGTRLTRNGVATAD